MRRLPLLGLAATAVLLAGCGAPAEVPNAAPAGPIREHWQLSHRVPESAAVRVVGQRLDAYSESTRVRFGPGSDGPEVLCSVTVSTPGWGGPENRVGEQVPATVQGRPALRNGAGAEGSYLMWQRADGRWAESICDDDSQVVDQDRLAALVTAKPATLALPFTVSPLPPGSTVSSIEQDLPTGATTIHLGVRASGGQPESDLVLSYDVDLQRQEGRATTVAGHPATLDETPRDPGLCLAVQGHDVSVGASSSDTGPYPDRSDELPVMVALAESLRFPETISDRSSWFPAQDVFG